MGWGRGSALALHHGAVIGTLRFNILVVRTDGRGLRRFSVSRGLVRALAFGALVAVVVNVTLVANYVTLRREHLTLRVTRTSLERQASILERRVSMVEPMERRFTELLEEMTTWDRLHAAIVSPLGSERRPGPTGIGGAAAPIPARGVGDPIDTVLAYVRDETQRLRALARLTREAGSVLAALPSRLPVRGAVNSGFGLRRSPWTGVPEFHAGIDLAATSGTPINAGAPGVVRFAGHAAGYGNSVMLNHGQGVESRYGHLDRIDVAVGQRVERGQRIGLSGNTGRSTAPHLHYEVLVDGRPVDPRRVARE
jgi:murein DD-endopeptidase MepM/ murein hydrolase activator NlpD